MKKLKILTISCMAFFTVLLASMCAYASNGDVIGKVYSTDILAKIDGLNAPSYNIGGKTAIVIEELCDKLSPLTYAVDAEYDDSIRRLDVYMDSSQGFWGESYNEIKRGKVGQILGDVYETDIKVFVNGYEIKGMNIGGKTAVAIEDLGQIGGANEEFGYSKYRFTATWNAEEKIISLDFIGDYLRFSTLDYSPNLVYHQTNNVLSATFDRMSTYQSRFGNITLTDDFKANPAMSKLYYDDGNEKTEIGFTYVKQNPKKNQMEPYAVLYITNPDALKQKTDALRGTPPKAEEVLKMLDDKVTYETTGNLELEDFYVLTVKLLKETDEYNNIAYVAVKKTGGYARIYGNSTHYNQSVVKKTGVNTIVIGIAPYSDMHGKPSVLNCEFDLNNYTIG